MFGAETAAAEGRMTAGTCIGVGAVDVSGARGVAAAASFGCDGAAVAAAAIFGWDGATFGATGIPPLGRRPAVSGFPVGFFTTLLTWVVIVWVRSSAVINAGPSTLPASERAMV